MKKENSELKNKICELEQYSRNNNIELVGVPETPHENVETVMTKIGEKLGMPISPEQIDAIHRVPTRSATQPKPIVVRFHSRRARKTKIQAADLGPGLPQKPVFVNEHLTTENKRLMHFSSQKKRELSYKYLWTRNGNIYMKKADDSQPLKITCEQDIAKLV